MVKHRPLNAMEEKTQNFRMGQLDNLPDEEEEEEEEEEPPQAPDELEGYGEDDSDKVIDLKPRPIMRPVEILEYES